MYIHKGYSTKNLFSYLNVDSSQQGSLSRLKAELKIEKDVKFLPG
jgi:hypothetical protein